MSKYGNNSVCMSKYGNNSVCIHSKYGTNSFCMSKYGNSYQGSQSFKFEGGKCVNWILQKASW